MLLFSTVLKIKPGLTPDAFIELVLDWNKNNLHDVNVINNIDWQGEHNVRYGDNNLWLEFAEYGDTLAVRYEKKQADGVIWDTDYIMDFAADRLAVSLDRSYDPDAIVIDSTFSTPYFINWLIKAGWLETDDDLAVDRATVVITEDNLQLLVPIISLREQKNNLPIVYVSKTADNEDPLDVKDLAWRLKGVAHVLVQESNTTNAAITELCEGKNETDGNIGIYYPGRTMEPKRYLYRKSTGSDAILLEKILRNILQYSNTQRVETLLTWQGVNNAILHERLNKQIAATESAKNEQQEAELLVESVDEELKKLKSKIEELTRANEILSYENIGLKMKLSENDKVPLIYVGDEIEFYSGELRDLLLTILDADKDSLKENCRRSDLLKDIIRNNENEQSIKERAAQIKSLLRNYNGMTPKIRNAMESLGFGITEDGKHYKIIYYDDERYTFAIAKTPSDFRAGRNIVSQIINLIY